MDNQYNVLIDFVGAVIIGVILFTERRQKRRGDPINTRLLYSLMFCCAAIFLTDIPGLLMDGHTFPGARKLLWFVDTAYWALQIVYCWLWLLFADYWAFGSRQRLNKRALLYALPMVAELAMLAINPLTGWVFTLDPLNVYDRGAFYLPNMLPYVLYIAAALAVTVAGYRQEADPEQKRRKLSPVLYMFLPACGVVFDAFVYGISWVWPMAALSLLMVHLNVQQQYISDEQLAAARLESELTESRIAVMLSQIQPHFLYNALGAIRELCRQDPLLAEEATFQFSEFLRGNLESLAADKPISFERELAHTKNYLAIEKMRFGDYLTIRYDIRATLFRLPTLTLQPIVENAVRYGVTKREEGGAVTIATAETAAAFTVTITDDGIGFDPEKTHDDGRTHIGISNVRERLARMCGGTLEVTSTPGVGTVAVITLPKGGKSV